MRNIASWVLITNLGLFAMIPFSGAEAPNWKAPVLALETDPILRKKSELLSSKLFSSTELIQLTQALAQEMFARFRILGIAAPQMGVGLRIFLLRSSFINPFDRSYEVFINPSIQPLGDSTDTRIEFCLSTKGFHRVKRYRAVRLEFYTMEGRQKVIELTGSRARIAQHELDHLDGKLISDKLNADFVDSP